MEQSEHTKRRNISKKEKSENKEYPTQKENLNVFLIFFKNI